MSEIGTGTSKRIKKVFLFFFQTTEMANADLDKYYKALDRYIVIFLILFCILQYFDVLNC